MNQITVAGHLGSDPEVRFTSSGKKVTTLRVAARARKSGKDETIWWKVTLWGEQFDKMITFFKKGHPIVVFGELSPPEIFTDREGKSQVSMNITAQQIMFSPFGKPESGTSHHAAEPQAHPSSTAEVFAGASAFGQGSKGDMNFQDDDIPF